MATSDPITLEERLLDATYRCVVRFGLAKTTVEDVVRESGASRASVYRQFPGGRDELLRATVAREIGRFFTALGDAVREAPDLPGLLEDGLVHAHQALGEHELLRTMLATEPTRLLPLLTTEAPRVRPFIAAFLAPYLEREAAAGRLRDGVGVGEAADYLARGILSLVGAPGSWDLEDRERVHEVVRVELLGGILRAPD